MKNTVYLLNKAIENNALKAEEGAQKILIFPRGQFFVEKYGASLAFDDDFFKRVIDNFKNEKLSKPFIDKNHEFRESFGDITALEITEAGVMASIKLNKKGAELVKDREYRYVSPSYSPVSDSQGVKYQDVLVTVSLTNVPALNGSLPMLQEQIQLSRGGEAVLLEAPNDRFQWQILKDVLQKWRESIIEDKGIEAADKIIPQWQVNNLEIPAEAPGEIVQMFEKFKRNKGGNDMTQLARHLGLVESANETTILEGVKGIELERDRLKGENAALLDRVTKAEATATELGKKVLTHEQEKLKAEAESVVMLAIQNGQYAPALKELKINQYLNGGKAIIEEEVRLLEKRPGGQKSASGGGANSNLDATDRAIMLERGMNPDDAADVKKYTDWNK